jgi:Rod binding domain-containing protein
MSVDSITPGILSTQGMTAVGKDSPEKIREAASQFEALLIGQVLKSAHGDDGGWLGSGEDASAGSAMGMADEYLARSLSSRGGLGLAKMIAQGLDRRS